MEALCPYKVTIAQPSLDIWGNEVNAEREKILKIRFSKELENVKALSK